MLRGMRIRAKWKFAAKATPLGPGALQTNSLLPEATRKNSNCTKKQSLIYKYSLIIELKINQLFLPVQTCESLDICPEFM